MEIETNRLRIIALTPEQLKALADHVTQLEEELKCSYQGKRSRAFLRSFFSYNTLSESQIELDAWMKHLIELALSMICNARNDTALFTPT